MAQSKIEFRLGDMHFIGEGEKTWVTRQLDKIINQAPSLLRAAEKKMSGELSGFESKGQEALSPDMRWNRKRKAANRPEVESIMNVTPGKDLASFIRSKKAAANQRATFLATAAWLAQKGKTSFVTRDVTKAIGDAKLPKLVNASVNLSQNLKQGYLVKSGKGFTLSEKAKKVF